MMTRISFTRISQHSKRRAALCLLVLLVMLSLTASLADNPYSRTEQAIFDAIYGLPNFLQPVIVLITQLGSGWALAGLLGWLLYKRQKMKAVLLAGSGLATFLIVELLKHLYGRPRPYALSEEVVRRDPLTSGGFGFPSGHAAMAMVLAIFLLVFFPRIPRLVIFVGLCLVGLSRVYLGMHAPLDIVAGFIVGALVALPVFGLQLLAKDTSKA